MNKFIVHNYRRALALLVGVGVFPALAAAEGNIDVTAATDVLNKLQNALNTYWEAAQPFVVAIVGIVVVASLIWAGVRLFRGGTSKISGR